MKQTPLYNKHVEADARIIEFAGYAMPVEYTGVIDEHLNVRSNAGIFDVSHMGEFWVKGKGALELLQYITPNNVAALKAGQAQYTCLPNGNGGIVDDFIIYRYEEEKYMLVVNAANIEKDWKWINEQNHFGAELENASEQMALLAVQGPKASSIVQELTNEPVANLNPFHFTTVEIQGVGEVIISATGYTGAGGFELYCYNQGAEELWNKLLEAGTAAGLKPAGLAARDTLRLEMGYPLYGNDIDDTTSPIEAGLGWIVKLKSKGDFIDRKLIEVHKTEGVSRKLVGIELLDRGIPRHGYGVLNEQGEEIGIVTSGTMSPSLKKSIGMAYVKTAYANPDTSLKIKIRNKELRAKVVKMPFLKK